MQLLALTLVLVAAAWAGRRLLKARTEDAAPLRIVARAGLTQKSGLALVEADGARLLVGFADGVAPILLHLPDPATGPALVLEDPVEIEAPTPATAA